MLRWTNPLQWRNIHTYNHPVREPFLLGPASVGLGGGAGAITTLDGAPIPTSLTLGGITAGTSLSRGILASSRQTPKVGWSLEARSEDPTRTMAPSY